MKKLSVLILSLLWMTLGYAQVEIEYISGLPSADTSSRGTDVWGYIDPVTDKEYALVGSFNSFSVVDISDVRNPELVAFLPNVKGFDIKVWGHYAYSCGGNATGNMNIIDLSDPTNPQVVGGMPNTHNLFIDDQGFLYAAFPDARIYDLNMNPENPPMIWQDTLLSGHDVAVFGDRMIFFEGFNGTFIYDVSDRYNPVLESIIIDFSIQYHHSGWLSRDGNYLYICDELARHPTPDITVWNISDLGNPEKVMAFSDPNAIVHNLYVIEDYAYVSYYMNGFRVFDISEPSELELAAEFETFPDSSVEDFNGAFGVYPFTRDGYVLINDMTYGLMIFDVTTAPLLEQREDGLAWPNPFTDEVRVMFDTQEGVDAKIEIFDVAGRKVNTLFQGLTSGGYQWFSWDGVNQLGWQAASGIYLVRFSQGDESSVVRIRKD